MNIGIQMAGIAAISMVAAGASYWIKGAPVRMYFCDVSTLQPGEICLQQILSDDGLLWVDARSRKDWEKNGVEGSILWNLDPAEDMLTFEAEASVQIAGAQRVVVYCGDENCGISREVAKRIRKLDFGPEVVVLRGGWRALSEADRVKGIFKIR